jgi:outer membrane receptor for ferrienterochelin and colicins
MLNENQREQTQFGILSWQHSRGPLDWQSSVTARNSTLQFTPDPLGDLLFNGIAQDAYKRNVAYDWQTDASYRLSESHTLRAGWFVQVDTSTSLTGSLVLPTNSSGQQSSQIPGTIVQNASRTEHIESLYLQDEWKWTPTFTVNYGLRFDTFSAYTSATQWSPRLNAVWKALPETTVHAGYARYLSPPPFELVGAETVAQFANTTAAPQVTLDTTPYAERANYTDVGVLQNITQHLTVGLDSYYKLSTNLIDEGQFGAPIILTPFNYQSGRQYGVELTANYAGDALSAYASLAWQSAMGRDINSAQFNFSAADLAYIANNYIHLDHEQKITASGGLSYGWGDTRLSTDFLLGSGLRANLVLPGGMDIPNGAHLPYYTQLNLGASHEFLVMGDNKLTVRLDLINALDKVYEIRNGTGVGVGAPQFGPRRGLFGGLSLAL